MRAAGVLKKPHHAVRTGSVILAKVYKADELALADQKACIVLDYSRPRWWRNWIRDEIRLHCARRVPGQAVHWDKARLIDFCLESGRSRSNAEEFGVRRASAQPVPCWSAGPCCPCASTPDNNGAAADRRHRGSR
ncbi:hypothetical protein ACTMU2_40530 [Cupriavidus basilensis]